MLNIQQTFSCVYTDHFAEFKVFFFYLRHWKKKTYLCVLLLSLPHYLKDYRATYSSGSGTTCVILAKAQGCGHKKNLVGVEINIQDDIVTDVCYLLSEWFKRARKNLRQTRPHFVLYSNDHTMWEGSNWHRWFLKLFLGFYAFLWNWAFHLLQGFYGQIWSKNLVLA